LNEADLNDIFFHGSKDLVGLGPLHEIHRSHSNTFILRRAPRDQWSVRRRNLYLTTHNIHERQTSTPQQDSNPQSQQTSGRKTAQPLESANRIIQGYRILCRTLCRVR